MSVIVVLIGFGIILAGSFLLAFFWAVKTGQFDDRHTPAIRMLFEDEKRDLKSDLPASPSRGE